MKISARNQFKGTILSIEEGAVNGIVRLDIGGGNVVTSTISMASIRELGLRHGLCRGQGHLGHDGGGRLSPPLPQHFEPVPPKGQRVLWRRAGVYLETGMPTVFVKEF